MDALERLAGFDSGYAWDAKIDEGALDMAPAVRVRRILRGSRRDNPICYVAVALYRGSFSDMTVGRETVRVEDAELNPGDQPGDLNGALLRHTTRYEHFDVHRFLRRILHRLARLLAVRYVGGRAGLLTGTM